MTVPRWGVPRRRDAPAAEPDVTPDDVARLVARLRARRVADETQSPTTEEDPR